MGDGAGAIAAFHKYIAMERRPEEQKWVDKARVELRALEEMAAPPPPAAPAAPPTGKLQERTSSSDEARERLDRELRRDAVLPPSDDDMRLIDPFTPGPFAPGPFATGLRDLEDPFHPDDVIINPFESAPSASAERLRQYGVALAAFRRALARHA